MAFYHDAPNSPVPDFSFPEFLVNPFSTTSQSKSAQHTCKSHISPAENFLHLLLSNTCPVDARGCFNVCKTSMQCQRRCIDILQSCIDILQTSKQRRASTG